MPQTIRLLLPAGLLAALLALAAGCNGNDDYLTPDRLTNGLVIILPGIEGESELNRDVRKGLIAGGVYRGMPIYSWGRPIPLAGVLINQVDFLGNRLSGIGVAKMITAYQDSNPGRPVHIVGHSGGGGVAVFAAEALPEGRQIDGLILLSASISSAYDLTKACSRCRSGVVNFYNPDDTGLLGVGTTVMGTVDGTHGPSAGLIGFDKAGAKGNENVYQVKVSGLDASGDPHSSTTQIGFVSMHVAPWVLSRSWPASGSVARDPLPPEIPPAAPLAARARPSSAPAGAESLAGRPEAPADAPDFSELYGPAGPGTSGLTPPSAHARSGGASSPSVASPSVPSATTVPSSPPGPTPAPSTAPAPAPPGRPHRLNLTEAQDLVRKCLPATPQGITLTEITTDDIWGRLEAQVFRVAAGTWECGALFVKGQDVVPLGTSFGGLGATSLCVTDLNADGKPELLYAYSWGSGIHRACLGILRPDRTPLTPMDLGIVFWGPGPDAEWMFRKSGKSGDRKVEVLQATWDAAGSKLSPGRRLGTLRVDPASGRMVMDLANGLDSAIKSRIRINAAAPPAFEPPAPASRPHP